jgi:hypothetical protein
VSPEPFGINLFGDPDYQQRLKEESHKMRLLAEGDGKHFIVAWIGDQDMETQFVCEWDEWDENAPCHQEGGGCCIKNSYDSIGDDMMEAVEEPQLLKVRLPIGYRTEGSGEDFEDYIYSVRPDGSPRVEPEPADDVEKMVYWAKRIIENDGALSAGSSMDLDYAHDELTKAARSYLGNSDE